MRTLTPSEKRTIRFATIGISIYLVLFGGMRVWKHLDAQRTQYRQLLVDAAGVKEQIKVYEDKAEVVKTLMESFRLDPMTLGRSNLVAEASAAIQKAATSGGMQFGPIRESSGRAAGKELATMQLEGSGPVAAILGFLHNVTTLGYPLVIESVQITGDPSKPGAIKLSLTIVVLDFSQWKQTEVPNV